MGCRRDKNGLVFHLLLSFSVWLKKRKYISGSLKRGLNRGSIYFIFYIYFYLYLFNPYYLNNTRYIDLVSGNNAMA